MKKLFDFAATILLVMSFLLLTTSLLGSFFPSSGISSKETLQAASLFVLTCCVTIFANRALFIPNFKITDRKTLSVIALMFISVGIIKLFE